MDAAHVPGRPGSGADGPWSAAPTSKRSAEALPGRRDHRRAGSAAGDRGRWGRQRAALASGRLGARACHAAPLAHVGMRVARFSMAPSPPRKPPQVSRRFSCVTRRGAGRPCERHLRSPADFRSTLLLWVVGRHWAFWIKVGDGALSPRSMALWSVWARLGRANLRTRRRLSRPRLPARPGRGALSFRRGPIGFVAMSDGAAERLVANDGGRVSPRSDASSRAWGWRGWPSRTVRIIERRKTWKATTGDDKAIALVAMRPAAGGKLLSCRGSDRVGLGRDASSTRSIDGSSSGQHDVNFLLISKFGLITRWIDGTCPGRAPHDAT